MHRNILLFFTCLFWSLTGMAWANPTDAPPVQQDVKTQAEPTASPPAQTVSETPPSPKTPGKAKPTPSQERVTYVQGTNNNYGGAAVTWVNPENGDIVTSVIAPRSPNTIQQNIPVYVYPQVEPTYPAPSYSPHTYAPQPYPPQPHAQQHPYAPQPYPPQSAYGMTPPADPMGHPTHAYPQPGYSQPGHPPQGLHPQQLPTPSMPQQPQTPPGQPYPQQGYPQQYLQQGYTQQGYPYTPQYMPPYPGYPPHHPQRGGVLSPEEKMLLKEQKRQERAQLREIERNIHPDYGRRGNRFDTIPPPRPVPAYPPQIR